MTSIILGHDRDWMMVDISTIKLCETRKLCFFATIPLFGSDCVSTLRDRYSLHNMLHAGYIIKQKLEVHYTLIKCIKKNTNLMATIGGTTASNMENNSSNIKQDTQQIDMMSVLCQSTNL